MKDICNREESKMTVPSVGSKELVDKFKAKFLKEAQSIVAMDHPGIIRIFDVFEENDTAYYVMEYISGGSLSEKVRADGPMSEAQAVEYIGQVASALKYVHSMKMVHLDVKPSNIMLNSAGRAVLIDFGISKHYDSAGRQTSSTPVGYSQGYAPLEQMRAGDVKMFTPATDVYSLGATLYFLVTGMVPPDTTVINEDGLSRPSGMSDRMWSVVEAAMQPRRKDRLQSVDEFMSILEREGVEEEVASEGEPEPEVVVPTPVVEEEETKVEAVLEQPSVSVSDKPVKPESERKPGAELESDVSSAQGGIPKKKIFLKWAILAGAVSIVAVLAVVLILRRPDSGKKATAPNQTSNTHGTINGHDWVDLGTGVKWATTNVGAQLPEDYGDYYAWGEVETKETQKTDYSWSTYKWCNGHFDELTKYNTDRNYGIVGIKTELELIDDVARQKWRGSWRIPTDAEWTALRQKCTWTWTNVNGVKGYRVVGRNGNSIFLPAAGYRYYADLINAGSSGGYWSSSLYTYFPSNAWFVLFDSGNVSRIDNYRCLGRTVRPVSE